jgi:hypothetical protein
LHGDVGESAAVLDIAIAAGFVALIFCGWYVLGYLALLCWNVRVARRLCPACSNPLGKGAARSGIPYYEHLYGSGMRVLGGAWRYRDAQVVECPRCSAKVVIGLLGGMIETLDTDRDLTPRRPD